MTNSNNTEGSDNSVGASINRVALSGNVRSESNVNCGKEQMSSFATIDSSGLGLTFNCYSVNSSTGSTILPNSSKTTNTSNLNKLPGDDICQKLFEEIESFTDMLGACSNSTHDRSGNSYYDNFWLYERNNCSNGLAYRHYQFQTSSPAARDNFTYNNARSQYSQLAKNTNSSIQNNTTDLVKMAWEQSSLISENRGCTHDNSPVSTVIPNLEKRNNVIVNDATSQTFASSSQTYFQPMLHDVSKPVHNKYSYEQTGVKSYVPTPNKTVNAYNSNQEKLELTNIHLPFYVRRVYKCHVCQFDFASKSGWKKHFRNVHGGVIASSNSQVQIGDSFYQTTQTGSYTNQEKSMDSNPPFHLSSNTTTQANSTTACSLSAKRAYQPCDNILACNFCFHKFSLNPSRKLIKSASQEMMIN